MRSVPQVIHCDEDRTTRGVQAESTGIRNQNRGIFGERYDCYPARNGSRVRAVADVTQWLQHHLHYGRKNCEKSQIMLSGDSGS